MDARTPMHGTRRCRVSIDRVHAGRGTQPRLRPAASTSGARRPASVERAAGRPRDMRRRRRCGFIGRWRCGRQRRHGRYPRVASRYREPDRAGRRPARVAVVIDGRARIRARFGRCRTCRRGQPARRRDRRQRHVRQRVGKPQRLRRDQRQRDQPRPDRPVRWAIDGGAGHGSAIVVQPWPLAAQRSAIPPGSLAMRVASPT